MSVLLILCSISPFLDPFSVNLVTCAQLLLSPSCRVASLFLPCGFTFFPCGFTFFLTRSILSTKSVCRVASLFLSKFTLKIVANFLFPIVISCVKIRLFLVKQDIARSNIPLVIPNFSASLRRVLTYWCCFTVIVNGGTTCIPSTTLMFAHK